MYVIQRSDGQYVCPVNEQGHVYTKYLQEAKTYSSRAAAESDACPENEAVLAVEQIMSPYFAAPAVVRPEKIVYVIADCDEIGVMCRIVDDAHGISPVYYLSSDRANGNPYLVFGDQVEQWTGESKYRSVVKVAWMRSGTLEREK